MKPAIFLTALLLASSHLQLLSQEGGPMVVSGVSQQGDIVKEDLYNRAYLWASDGVIEGKYSIHETDPGTGLLVVSSSFPFTLKNKVTSWRRIEGNIYYRLSIYTRDGRYKYVFSHFVHEGSGEQPINYGKIYDGKSTEFHPDSDTHVVVINELRASARQQAEWKAQSLEAVMKKPTELETEW